MPLECPGIITRNSCNGLNISRYTPGRTGYTGAPAVAAIVLHLLQGTSPDAYNDQLTTPLPRFLCGVPGPSGCGEFPNTINPKSVHFVVTPTSTVQYAEITNTTIGLDYYLNATWPGLTPLIPITDINGPFIHVAITNLELTETLVGLLCCIGIAVGAPLPIIAASDLQSDRPQIVLSTSLQTQVDSCVAAGGVQTPPSIFDLEDRVEELELCCLNNTTDILVLQQGLETLTGRVVVLEDKVAGIEVSILNILDQLTPIAGLVTQVATLTNLVNDILVRCCPVQLDSSCFNYQLLPGSEMLITPNQPVWLNLPTKIEDREGQGCPQCCPAIVTPGPLWAANLCDTPCGCATWSLEATVRFRLAQWCAGKKASLYLVACGVKYLIAEQTIASTSPQAITLQGVFLLPTPPCCSDVHLLVATNDDNITSAKVVEFAQFKGCCA